MPWEASILHLKVIAADRKPFHAKCIGCQMQGCRWDWGKGFQRLVGSWVKWGFWRRFGMVWFVQWNQFGKGERAKSDWKEEKGPSRMSGNWFEEMREVKQEEKRGKSEEKWSNTWVENWPPGQSWLNGVCTDTKASTSAQTVTTVFSGRFPLGLICKHSIIGIWQYLIQLLTSQILFLLEREI